ncbi:uncharacterized protein RCC_01824 [Ramularia collo-cygni]|uniref:Uncharacterized protein n=1 Tax=Ramularia collo-cygni TaxID=112498 RepID=A0A2D3V0J2_9PEZI|nr:uncharacterized protein RCC_01824 [Ramularia collo-cygni]CZT15984.1 uncharacterized protein RCC_01824 [Ramularia collo-cygni]
MRSLFLAALVASVLATPIELEGRSGNAKHAYCSAIKTVVIPAKDLPAATTYCSSYLSLKPRATTTVTRTITNAKVTATVTATTTKAFVCQAPTGSVEKREASKKKVVQKSKPKPKPSCLGRYTKTAAISSACSCLTIPTGPVTSTTTKVLTGTVTVTATRTAVQTPAAFHLRALSDDEALDGHELSGGGGQTLVERPYQGLLFSLDAQGQLRNASYPEMIANVDGTTSSKPRRDDQQIVYLSDAEEIEEDDRVPLNCKIVPRDDLTCALQCSTVEYPVGLINSTPDVDSDDEQRWVLATNAAGPVFTHIIVPDEEW